MEGGSLQISASRIDTTGISISTGGVCVPLCLGMCTSGRIAGSKVSPDESFLPLCTGLRTWWWW